MAQTEKDFATIIAALADNVGGDISAQDIRDAFASTQGYGGMMLSTAGAPADVSSVGTSDVLVDIFDTIVAKSIDRNLLGANVELGSNHRITFGSAGFYHISFFASFASSLGNKLVSFTPYVSGSIGAIEVSRFVSTGTDVGAIAFDTILSCAPGEYIDVRVKINTGTTDLTFSSAGFNIFRVG
jgi:hypothetical protein